MRKLITTALLAGALAAAAPAHADPESDFLGYMSAHGAMVNPFTSGFLISGGNAACNDIRAGVPADQVRVAYPGASDQAIRELVTGAHLYLCP